jgi:hypothetical protein
LLPEPSTLFGKSVMVMGMFAPVRFGAQRTCRRFWERSAISEISGLRDSPRLGYNRESGS